MAYQELGSTVHTFDDSGKPVKGDKVESVEFDLAKDKPVDTTEEDDGLEIVIEDDTPDEDKDKKEAAPIGEVTEDELTNYSSKVQNRIKQLTRKANDERRAKEQIERQNAELQRVAQQLLEETNMLKGTVTKNQTALITEAKRTAEMRLAEAKRQYKEAYESGDADKVVAAQEELTSAKIHVERVNSVKAPSLQEQKPTVQQPPQQQATPPVDTKVKTWAEKNTWFGSDDELTSYALGYHSKLVKEGVDPKSDEYYEKIDSRMREKFPEKFGDPKKSSTARATKPNVVAPATRSQAPKKVTLTQTQVSIAKRLGVSLADYARHYAATMNGDSNE
jgi:hypothetical protein